MDPVVTVVVTTVTVITVIVVRSGCGATNAASFVSHMAPSKTRSLLLQKMTKMGDVWRVTVHRAQSR